MKLGHRAISVWATPLPASQGWRSSRFASRPFERPMLSTGLFSSAWEWGGSVSHPWRQKAMGSLAFSPRSRP